MHCCLLYADVAHVRLLDAVEQGVHCVLDGAKNP